MRTNNKLREAIELAKSTFETLIQFQGDEDFVKTWAELGRDTMIAALAEQVKNCEVGTLEDRRERFKQFCKSHSDGVACDRNCPLFKLHINGYSCHFEWGELPFESEA